ncbi:hypothetical protein BdWA1_000034 [Babesia duncani]|uniref:Uncharacterized protein n=1 Tax=Babesia duncani TaxID=323732 RepID=A0AAD9PLI1_9APIC|nr:hypothetical protein BdWA1_000034 [Babesia duncani]
MARGGHKGLLYAVSGRMTTIFGKRRKRGLYHQCTNEFFKPRWGPIKQPYLLQNYNLKMWADNTIEPNDKIPPNNIYDREARLAWPVTRTGFVSTMYVRNERQYFKPAILATNDKIREYIYNVLEPGYNQCFSGIGVDFNPPESCIESNDMIIFRFQRLYTLIKESDSWRQVSQIQESTNNPFPHVNEGASLIRNLALSDILHVKSNHRLNRRAHPKWYAVKYRKFLQKKRIQEKLHQLRLEEANSAVQHS